MAANNTYTQSLQDSAALAYIAPLSRNPTFQEYFSALKVLSLGGSSTDLARQIGQTPEFFIIYAGQTTAAISTLLYFNLLQRMPNAAEITAASAFINASLASGNTVGISTAMLASALASSIFSGSSGTPSDNQFLKNKVSAAQATLYAQAQSTPLTADQVSMVLAIANPTSVSVLDQTVNIANNLDALAAAANKLTAVTPLGLASLAITAIQLSNDAAVLNLINTPYTLTVSGVSAGNISTVFGNSHVTSISIADTAVNILTSLSALQTNLNKISAITQTDLGVPITMAASQLSSAVNVLGLITGNYALAISGASTSNLASALANTHVTSIALSDTASNLSNYLDLIQANLGRFSSITQSNPGSVISITASQLTNDWAALNYINNYKVSISDSAVNLVANLNSLQQNLSRISTINVVNGSSLTVTPAQEAANVGALALIQQGGGNYSVKSNAPSYNLTASTSFINEGASDSIILQTTNLTGGTSLAYAITGIAANRLSSGTLNGTVSVDANGQAIIPLSVINNNHTDGPAIAVITIGNNLASTSVSVIDSSLTPGTVQVALTPKATYVVNTPNLMISGTSDVDAASFVKTKASVTITISGTQTSVVDNSGTLGTTILNNVERLQFSDTNVALDVGPTQNAGAVYMLYKAAFNRASDPSGMGYWLAQKDSGKDIVINLAQGFVNSPEFIAKYGTNPSNASYVDKLYQNVLGRAGETGGVAYWNQELDAGRISKAAILVQFATLAEGASLVADEISHGIVYQQWVG